MNMQGFLNLCKNLVINDYRSKDIKPNEVFIVWSCKTLQNAKALLATDIDGNYYEFTYDGDKEDMYMDKYKHVSNKSIK